MKNNKHYDIREIFEQMELDLISSMRRAFYFHKREEAKEGFSWEQWQKSKIRAIEEYRKKNKLLVDSYSKPIQEAIDREVKVSFKSSIKNTVDKVKRMLGISVPDDISETQKVRDYIKVITGQKIEPPPEQSFFGVNDKKVNALQKVVENDLKKAQYSVLRKMDDVYRQTIYKSQVYMQSGAVTLNKAIDMATRDFLSKGINSIKYSDGKNVNIATYAEMCLRTANHRAKLLGEGSKRDEWGIHLVVVSAHANTCKLCAKWQGKILIDDVFSHPSSEYINQYKDKYELLSTAVKDGLMHVNCRHNIVTYFEGVTSVPVIQDEDEAVNMYREEQKQRAFERAIRKQKRIIEGTCDEVQLQQEEVKLKALEKSLREHLKKYTELRRNSEREKVRI
ncbi:phage minor capsid protein [Clostridium butyricum]